MDTHRQQTGPAVFIRGMPASRWIEATTRRQRKSETTVQTSGADVSGGPSAEEAPGPERREASTPSLPERPDVAHRHEEE
jgi:hypothetical protein